MSLSTLRIPVPGAARVALRCSPLPRRGEFEPHAWPQHQLTATHDGWWQIDLATLALPTGGMSTSSSSIARYPDLANHVVYCTSHDVEKDDEQRLFSYFVAKLAGESALVALDQTQAAFALTLTAAGMPMFLAGEESARRHRPVDAFCRWRPRQTADGGISGASLRSLRR
jgi:hypothetical protein